MKKKDIVALVSISTSSIANLTKWQSVNTDMLVKIYCAMKCDVADIMEILPDEGKQQL